MGGLLGKGREMQFRTREEAVLQAAPPPAGEDTNSGVRRRTGD